MIKSSTLGLPQISPLPPSLGLSSSNPPVGLVSYQTISGSHHLSHIFKSNKKICQCDHNTHINHKYSTNTEKSTKIHTYWSPSIPSRKTHIRVSLIIYRRVWKLEEYLRVGIEPSFGGRIPTTPHLTSPSVRHHWGPSPHMRVPMKPHRHGHHMSQQNHSLKHNATNNASICEKLRSGSDLR